MAMPSFSASWLRCGLSVRVFVCLETLKCSINVGSFDSSVHISEEASNAATAVPWAIVFAIFISGVLGWGM